MTYSRTFPQKEALPPLVALPSPPVLWLKATADLPLWTGLFWTFPTSRVMQHAAPWAGSSRWAPRSVMGSVCPHFPFRAEYYSFVWMGHIALIPHLQTDT